MFYCIPKSNVKPTNFIPQIHTSYEWRNFVEYMTLFRSRYPYLDSGRFII